jgi:hypothetical protein
MSREAMQIALDALEANLGNWAAKTKAVEVLHQALETEREPVAWRTFDGEGGYDYRSYEMNENYDKEWVERNPNHAHWVEPLYTSPQKQWAGLTDEEIYEYADKYLYQHGSNYGIKAFGKAIEAKLKEKNT